jgi:hypothetical protein
VNRRRKKISEQMMKEKISRQTMNNKYTDVKDKWANEREVWTNEKEILLLLLRRSPGEMDT